MSLTSCHNTIHQSMHVILLELPVIVLSFYMLSHVVESMNKRPSSELSTYPGVFVNDTRHETMLLPRLFFQHRIRSGPCIILCIESVRVRALSQPRLQDCDELRYAVALLR